MKFAPHATTMNGRISTELWDRLESPEETIRKSLMLLDGTDRYSLSLWKLPEGRPFDRINFKKWPQEYIQVAGSRDCMTVEIRRMEDIGPRQYVVGHEAHDDQPERNQSVLIHWNDHELTVLARETFDAVEAADLFISYFKTGAIPASYTLRKLDL